jgi:hypothetical protein
MDEELRTSSAAPPPLAPHGPDTPDL